MNKVDNFFKMKVDSITTEPRVEAWAKLEANLSKKNESRIWFRIAAALLVAGLLVSTIILLQSGEGKNEIAQELKKEIPAKALDNRPKTDNTIQSLQVENKNLAKRNSTNKKEKKSELLTSPLITKKIESEFVTTSPIEIETIQRETSAVAAIEKPIVIEYTLASIPLRKKDVPVLAETVDKKNNLQKALDFAREAKNSDSPLGELRQAKDDLFALNFKKDKQKKQ